MLRGGYDDPDVPESHIVGGEFEPPIKWQLCYDEKPCSPKTGAASEGEALKAAKEKMASLKEKPYLYYPDDLLWTVRLWGGDK